MARKHGRNRERLLAAHALLNSRRARQIASSLLAGLGASTIHLALMALKHRLGVLPEFEPYEDLQRLLSGLSVQALEPPWSWLLPYANGALVLGFLFGRLYAVLPGRNAIAKGMVFGLAAWLALGLGLLPLAGDGLFGFGLGLGAWPAGVMLAMVTSYAVVMSLLYGWLRPRAG